ncbi:MAG TPA: L,D-transpeptidase [Ignavibacteria bacterium]|nr:L,D-transpeptidase [Ignavibacteria bacterium]
MKNFITLLVFVFIICSKLSAQEANSIKEASQESPRNDSERFYVETSSQEQADLSMREHITEFFPIIPESAIEEILSTRQSKPVVKIDEVKGDTSLTFEWSYYVKPNFNADTTKIFWQLNIPQFQSNIYQLYQNDTIYLDTWNHVVGAPSTKTLTGNFTAFRIRNWPTWKDPDPKLAHLEATPPGPKNPLGLFTVWYDENSLRYFHGTNKPYLLDDEIRSLSHGCVRTDNDNIDKMKRFLIRRVIKSKDLNGWIGSKRTMQYDFEEVDKFPVQIIYKTFDINKDANGHYIELFKDVYKYENQRNINIRENDPSLITLSTKENIKAEFVREFNKGLTEQELDFVIDWLLANGEQYQKYYFSELQQKFLMK